MVSTLSTPRVRAALLTPLTVLTLTAGAATAVTPAAGAAVTAGPALIGTPDVVAYETGRGSINATDSSGDIAGTDLGITWDDGAGHVLVAYGDTFGAPFTPPDRSAGGGPEGGDWRSNVLAVSSDHTLADGMSFDRVVTDRSGHAKELLASKKVSGDEMTVIPTSGISVGSRQFMTYMSVRQWGPAGGQWSTNYGGLAYSDDDGTTWTTSAVRWPNSGAAAGFQQAALVRRGGYVYLLGTGNGRFGPARAARVPEGSLLDQGAYRYWDGAGWQADPAAAAVVVGGTVAEMSLQWNAYLGRYLLSYIDPDADALVLRQADSPQGPWSAETVVQRSAEYSSMYGGFLHPWSNGRDLYFQMSQWRSYNTFTLHATLAGTGTTDTQNAVRNGTFESATSGWSCTGSCGVDADLGNQHSGTSNGWVRNHSGWNDLHRTVAVTPGRTYHLRGWLRTSSTSDNGYFGVRTTDGRVLGEAHFTHLDGYRRVDVDVAVGTASSVVVYGGVWTDHGDIWLQVDDVSLFPA